MDPFAPGVPIIPGQHYSSYADGASAWLATLYTIDNSLDFDEVMFSQGNSTLFLELVEPVGLFKGGVVLGAGESYYPPIGSFFSQMEDREDWTGSAILIDPAIVDLTSPPSPITLGPSTPEPGTGIPMIAALLFLASVSGRMASRKGLLSKRGS
jgi:hypothetical protein